MKIITALISVIFMITPFCEARSQVVQRIDLTKMPTKEQSIKMSLFSSKITYLALETKSEFLISGGPKFFLLDSLVVVCAHRQILIFNAINGKFIRKIGEYGHGPNGYMNAINAYKKNGQVLISGIGWDFATLEYSTNGDIINKVKVQRYPRDIAWLKDNYYALFYMKSSNKDNLQLLIYDQKNQKEIWKFFDNRNFKETNKYTFFGAHFYRYNDQLFMKEYFNDTIFQITEKKMIPKYFFESGKYSPPFYEKSTFDFTQYHNINSIIETENWIFFVLNFQKRTHYCCFDKKANKIKITGGITDNCGGVENDIDGFVPFRPQTLSDKNELVGFVYPYQIKQWFEENQNKAIQIPSKIKHLKNIQMNDNPVLMLVKLKE